MWSIGGGNGGSGGDADGEMIDFDELFRLVVKGDFDAIIAFLQRYQDKSKNARKSLCVKFIKFIRDNKGKISLEMVFKFIDNNQTAFKSAYSSTVYNLSMLLHFMNIELILLKFMIFCIFAF